MPKLECPALESTSASTGLKGTGELHLKIDVTSFCRSYRAANGAGSSAQTDDEEIIVFARGTIFRLLVRFLLAVWSVLSAFSLLFLVFR